MEKQINLLTYDVHVSNSKPPHLCHGTTLVIVACNNRDWAKTNRCYLNALH